MTEEPARLAMPLRSSPSTTWLFFAAVFGWTWFFWIVAAATSTSVRTPLGNALLLTGLLGPTVSGLAFAWFTLGRDGRLDYWQRLIDPRRIPASWYAVILLFVPGLMAIAVVADVAWGDRAAPALIGAKMAPLLAAPSSLVPFLAGVFIMGPLTEEFGWRGYALDRLQARWSPLASSIVLGTIWALWHLPLFFIKDTYHFSQGAGSLWFWLFLAGVIPTAVIFTWIFNNTRRSTLGAILFHFMANLTYVIGDQTAVTNIVATLLWFIAAMAVVSRTKSFRHGKEGKA